jgi:RimJ/RimL family protein N-acetyltransferase
MVMGLKPKLQGYHQEVRLLDGKKVVLRLITSNDKKALTEFYSRVSNESRFYRYHYSKGELSEDDLANFCDVDYQDSLGMVAEQEHEGQKEIIGVARFYRLPTNIHMAEIAILVQDSEQRKGLGTSLLKYLAKLAWELDIYFFSGEVLRENSRLLSICRRSDPEMNVLADGESTCAITLSVEEMMHKTPNLCQ